MTAQTEAEPVPRTSVPRRNARRGLAVYFAVLIPLSALVTARVTAVEVIVHA